MAKNNAPFIGTEALTTLGAQIMPDIALSAYIDREATFRKLGIKVISGDEFQNIRYAIRTKGHTTRRKGSVDTLESQAGEIVERKLVTHVAYNRYRVNKNMFRELPRQVGEQLMYPNSEANLRIALQDYSADVFDNLFFGDVNGAIPALALYDGFWTYIAKDVTDGYIKPIHLSAAIVRPTSTTDTQAWELFVEFMDALDPALRRMPDLHVACDPVTASAIYSAYSHAHGDRKEMGINEAGNYIVAEYPNVQIAFDDCLGHGCRLIAYGPDELEYGVDTLDPENGMSIAPETSKDNDDFIIQPQSAQGVRAFRVDSKHFAMTDATMTFEAMSGDYRDIHLFVSSSDETLGTVTVDSAAPDSTKLYTPGQIVTLKANKVSNNKFVKWSNGTTNETLTYTVGNQSEALVAIFEANA